jgi:flavin-dependent dehydrogenase
MFDVIVIGGGISGCATATILASLGHTVLLLEQGHYPAHKICGEFLSTEVMGMLHDLGVAHHVNDSGAVPIYETRITSESGRSWHGQLPGTAYGLSRYRFDKILFDRASSSGAVCRMGNAVQRVHGNLDDGFFVTTATETFAARLVIAAYGKKPAIFRHRNGMFGGKKQSALVAFKQHHTGSSPINGVEVHTFDRGYCGINRVENGAVNVCWMVQAGFFEAHGKRREDVFRAAMERNHHLKKAMSDLIPLPGTLCAISGISLKNRGHFVDDICQVGDASQMIAPFCGDGMGMAIRSAQIAAPLCSAFIRNNMSARGLRRQYAAAWHIEFSRRLMLGQAVQAVAFLPAIASGVLGALNIVPSAGDWLLRNTRSPAYPLLPKLQ